MLNKDVIICVDDEMMVLDVLKVWMQEIFGETYAVECAESGEEALEVISDCLENGRRVCLVITDYNMPGIKGDELISRLASLVPEAVAIMLTGQVSPDAIEATAQSPNFFCTVAKPWASKDLIATIEEALAAYHAE